MFDPALRGYWGSADVDRAMGHGAGAVIEAHTAKVDGIKISLLDKDSEIAMRRRLPPGVRMYTGDDFNYAELIAGDGVGSATYAAAQRCAARHLRRDRAGRERGAAALAAATRSASTHPRADRAAVAPHLQAPTRFYKTGVVFMAWLNGHQEHFVMVGGQQSTRSLLHLRELFGWPMRRADRAARAGGTAMRTLLALHGDARLMRDFATDHRWLSINTATCARQMAARPQSRTCAARGIRAIRRGATRCAAAGSTPIARAGARHGIELSGYCRGGMFPAPSRRAGSARATTTGARRRSRDAERRLPRAGGRRPARRAHRRPRTQGHRRRAQRRARRHRRALEYAKTLGMPLAIEPLHPMYAADRACVNTLEQALDLCDALDPARSGARWRGGRPSTTSGGTRSCSSRSHRAGRRAPARLPRLRLAGATPRPADRPRHDGRRNHRDPEASAAGSRTRLRGLQRSGDLLQRELVEARGGEVLDTCIARHRSGRLDPPREALDSPRLH
jgi:hypothetical protein